MGEFTGECSYTDDLEPTMTPYTNQLTGSQSHSTHSVWIGYPLGWADRQVQGITFHNADDRWAVHIERMLYQTTTSGPATVANQPGHLLRHIQLPKRVGEPNLQNT